jgi:8-oxo-dGTP pyrophosphatase MutT (NUDIX family)
MQLIKKIHSRFESPLPGVGAQYQMAPLGRAELTYKVRSYTEAAVLCFLYPKKDIWHMVFIQRTSHEKDKHSAQIAFPGGKRDVTDLSLRATAIREAHEEINLIPDRVNIIGDLTPLKIPVSKFEVYPVIAYAEYTPTFKAQASEVEQIIELPVMEIIDPNNKMTGPMQLANGVTLENVPQFNFDGTIIWGATAMMLNEVIHLINH